MGVFMCACACVRAVLWCYRKCSLYWSYSLTECTESTPKRKRKERKLMANTKLQSCKKIENKCCQRCLMCISCSLYKTRAQWNTHCRKVFWSFCFYSVSVSVLCSIGCLLWAAAAAACSLATLRAHHCSQCSMAETIFEILYSSARRCWRIKFRYSCVITVVRLVSSSLIFRQPTKR